MIDELLKLFDGYNRKARIYPALIALLPIIFAVMGLGRAAISDFPTGAVAVVLVGCILYGLSALARSRGKIAEPRLLKMWGGWPSTTVLRHRDDRYDPNTKSRYHAKLSALCGGIILPSPQAENASPLDADNVYRSATKQFMELRRGPEYQMIHDENASYGFRRNLLGLKGPAIILAMFVAVVSGAIWWSDLPSIESLRDLRTVILAKPALPAIVAANILFIAFYYTVVTKDFVSQAAYEYADALFRTLDAP